MSTARYAKKRCSVEVCESDTRTAGVSLHRFPLDSRRREVWVRFCNNRSLQGKTPWQLRDRVVCSLHFEESAFLRPGHLRHNALPSVLPTKETTRGDISSKSSPGSAGVHELSSPLSSSCTYLGSSESRSFSGHPDDHSSEMELSWEQESISPAPSSCTYSGRSDSRSSCGHPDDQSSEVELSWEQESSSPASSSCMYSGRSDSRSSCGHPDDQSSEVELSWEQESSSPASSSCMYSGRSDSRSSCGHPDDQSSEVELSWEQESSSPASSSCTYSGRSDWWSFCGHPDNQSSEINLSWNAERISAAPLDHTYSCTVLKNSPLGAHIDHSYALPQDAFGFFTVV
ncbi:putative protein TPRXL [Ixodes scapularis]|uniref:putative protein TPRXL n=1 Tax=Ixodes scapularis TaxID=6945 RepID=UPI001A9CE20A|nr:putative protein TPRXL [Ixodes scapularis]